MHTSIAIQNSLYLENNNLNSNLNNKLISTLSPENPRFKNFDDLKKINLENINKIAELSKSQEIDTSTKTPKN